MPNSNETNFIECDLSQRRVLDDDNVICLCVLERPVNIVEEHSNQDLAFTYFDKAWSEDSVHNYELDT